MSNKSDLLWFPMRVTYNRELKIKEALDKLKIENFLPMRYEWVNTKKILVPAIHNLILIHSTQEDITDLKMTKKDFEPLRYMISLTQTKDKGHIIHVPDFQMNNFMRVASVQDESIMYLDCNDYINKIGKKVKITEGQFKGVEGVIKRIKKNKYIVVKIEGLAAVAITYVPADWIMDIS